MTKQEKLWEGSFGDAYTERNYDRDILAGRLALWTDIVRGGGTIDSCLELGSNVGLNLQALGLLLPKIQMTGVELNRKAADECAKLDRVKVIHGSLYNYRSDERFDLTFTAGVLVVIEPSRLPEVYDILYAHSKKYIALLEYYNPSPVDIVYRGQTGQLFKRDFAGEIMDRFPDVHLVDYGFVYHRDTHFPTDDVNWFLLEKRA